MLDQSLIFQNKLYDIVDFLKEMNITGPIKIVVFETQNICFQLFSGHFFVHNGVLMCKSVLWLRQDLDDTVTFEHFALKDYKIVGVYK